MLKAFSMKLEINMTLKSTEKNIFNEELMMLFITLNSK